MTNSDHDLPRRRRDRSPSRPMLQRDRLLDTMVQRTDRIATVISAGAGFGKSTLIEQAKTHPAMADQVSYVEHRVQATDTDGADLLTDLTAQIDNVAASVRDEAGAFAPDVSLADRLWHLSPEYVTVIVDDIHLFPSGSPAWEQLNDLILDLPDNADVIVSGRGFHELTLARSFARGDAVEIDERQLAFTDDELDQFADLRSVERSTLDDHGWPALVELEAQAGVAGAHEFVAQEVLASLPSDRLAALRRVCLHDRIDDRLVGAATDFTGNAADLLGSLPLTRVDASGSWILHDLWRGVLTADLADDERRASMTAGVELLRADGRLRDAIAAAVGVGDDDLTLDVLVDFARDVPLSHSIADRRSVLDLLPAVLSTSAEAELLRADIVFATAPMRSAEPLQHAIDVATQQNRPEVTVLALLRLGDMAYRSGDRAGLADSRRRLERLHDLGGRGADAAMVLTDSWLLLLENSAERAMELMEDPALRGYEPIASMADYYRGVMLGHAGHAEASVRALDTLGATPDGRILERRSGFAGLMQWWCGGLDADAREEALRTLDRLGDDRQQHLVVEGAGSTALLFASAGEVDRARALLDRAVAARDRVPSGSWAAITVELAAAVIEVMDGNEDAAAARLDAVVPDSGPFDRLGRHVFGNVGALLYVLLPHVRPFFDDEQTGPDLELATQVGRALVALREHQSAAPASRLPWHDLGRLRTWAYEPHLAELAVAAMSNGVSRASDALSSLVHEPRRSLRAAADRHPGPVGTLATEELDRTPRRPAHVTHVRVMGPTLVRVDAEPDASTPPIRRKMVRELLLLLVHRRRMRREEIAALIWPDKDDSAARNNLRATLNHLRSLLEHDDDADEGPPWHVRSDGESLELFHSDRLVVDVVACDAAVAAARRADSEGRPARTLEYCHEAMARYHGPYLADALDPDWGADRRLAMHLDHVEMCLRASELHQARGETEQALSTARRAAEVEPLSERAHRAIIRSLRSTGDRAGARRAFDRCVELLTADGLRPTAETQRLGDELQD